MTCTQVKVRKKSMAGRTEVRRLFVRGDVIELVNPEKRMFRSQSKTFPLSELTAVRGISSDFAVCYRDALPLEACTPHTCLSLIWLATGGRHSSR